MTIRTLVVEDDPMVADVNRRYIESVPGFAVVAVSASGDAALSAATRLRPDLVTLDLYIPQLSGLELLSQLRGLDLGIDVIMATAASDGEVIGRAMRLGVVDYLIKPYTYERFTQALLRYAAFRQTISAGSVLGQEAVDRLQAPPAVMGQSARRLPKGLEPLTLGRFCDCLASGEEPLTVHEIARVTGLSRVTCLRYLSHLVDQGSVAIELAYGALGRPSKLYRWRRGPTPSL